MELTPNFKLLRGSYRVWKFPSGEIQVKLSDDSVEIDIYEGITITGSILNSDHTMELMQLVETISYHASKAVLHLIMPYCAYSRQDRRCNTGESFSLKVFTDLINSCNFESVITYDNHSDVSTALLNNCSNVSINDILHTKALSEWYTYFISPDAGANKKVFSCSQQFTIPMVRADKIRDTSTGTIIDTQVYATSKQLKDSTVLIIDDICQGGRTFIELAKAIKSIEPSCTIHLYVTHGFFDKGFNEMKNAGISKFICTNSVPQHHTCNELTVISL